MNGYEYEEACARYLRKKGFKDVQVTQASRDQGADILARRKKEKYAVQCKYYAKPVGNKAVQEVYAAKTFYGCDRALVMSNATFTKGAKELAESLDVELMPGIEPKKLFPIARLIAWILFIATILLFLWVSGIAAFVLHRTFPQVFEAIPAKYFHNRWITAALPFTGAVWAMLARNIAKYGTSWENVTDHEDDPDDEEEPERQEQPKKSVEPEQQDQQEPPAPSLRELAIIYDLVDVAEARLKEEEDPAEQAMIQTTIEAAYELLIANEASLPEDWESPRERLAHFQEDTKCSQRNC